MHFHSIYAYLCTQSTRRCTNLAESSAPLRGAPTVASLPAVRFVSKASVSLWTKRHGTIELDPVGSRPTSANKKRDLAISFFIGRKPVQ